jgi:hypothetical protein
MEITLWEEYLKHIKDESSVEVTLQVTGEKEQIAYLLNWLETRRGIQTIKIESMGEANGTKVA